MRFLSLFALTLFAAPAVAQTTYCVNGKCYTVPSGAQLTPPGGVYASPGPAPSPDHELWLENGQLVWKVKAGVAVPKVMPPGIPDDIVKMYRAKGPAVVQADKPMHNGLFYRMVRNRAEKQFADKLVKEKGYTPADARAKAKAMIADLDDRTIDVIGKRLAGITEGVGGGDGVDVSGAGPLERLIDFIIANPDKIAKLIETILMLLMLFI